MPERGPSRPSSSRPCSAGAMPWCPCPYGRPHVSGSRPSCKSVFRPPHPVTQSRVSVLRLVERPRGRSNGRCSISAIYVPTTGSCPRIHMAKRVLATRMALGDRIPTRGSCSNVVSSNPPLLFNPASGVRLDAARQGGTKLRDIVPVNAMHEKRTKAPCV